MLLDRSRLFYTDFQSVIIFCYVLWRLLILKSIFRHSVTTYSPKNWPMKFRSLALSLRVFTLKRSAAANSNPNEVGFWVLIRVYIFKKALDRLSDFFRYDLFLRLKKLHTLIFNSKFWASFLPCFSKNYFLSVSNNNYSAIDNRLSCFSSTN